MSKSWQHSCFPNVILEAQGPMACGAGFNEFLESATGVATLPLRDLKLIFEADTACLFHQSYSSFSGVTQTSCRLESLAR